MLYLLVLMMVRHLVVGGIASAAIIISACSSDSAGSIPPDVQKFCDDLMASPAFGCCSEADRHQSLFAFRGYYGSSAECASQLSRSLGESQGRRIFDGAAAQACLGALQTRACNTPVTATAHLAAEKAGCQRVVAGIQGPGAPCDTNDDCKPGLLCPPVRQTGASTCIDPASANESCVGDAPTLDHPGCKPGLFCQPTGEVTDDCPAPPCVLYRCANIGEDGEGCTGLDCKEGLDCRDGLCHPATPPTGPGAPCRVAENCSDGLFCDTAVGSCQQRKPTGQGCRAPAIANGILECRGICNPTSNGLGVCGTFCGGS